MRGRCVVLCLCLGVSLGLVFLFPSLSRADDVRLLSVGIRGGASIPGTSILGRQEDEHFQQYEVVGTLGLPWSWYTESGWGLTTQVMGTLGALTSSGETAFLTTLVPGFAFGPRDSLFSLDIGVGGSLQSRDQFGSQYMGGPFHIAFTAGVRIPIYGPFGLGYRFHHLSDGGIYNDAKGVDTHMLELTYRFR